MESDGRWTAQILPGVLVGVCTSGLTFLVTWGSINTRVEKLEKSVDQSGAVHDQLRQELIDIRAYREAHIMTKAEMANHRVDNERIQTGLEYRIQQLETKIEQYCVRRGTR